MKPPPPRTYSRGFMSTTSRKSLYQLLNTLSQPRIDRGLANSVLKAPSQKFRRVSTAPENGFGATAPVFSRAATFDTRPKIKAKARPASAGSISDEQVKALIDGVSWINWSVATQSGDEPRTATAQLRPTVSDGLVPDRSESGPLFTGWILAILVVVAAVFVGLFHLGVFGIVLAVLLIGVIVGGIVQLAATPLGLVLLVLSAIGIPTLFALEARRQRYIRTVHAVEDWLGTAKVRTERVPSEWDEAKSDPSVHDLIVAWMLSGSEIQALGAHISDGVALHKNLSPDDPRERTLQEEIEVQRGRMHALQKLRDAQAEAATDAARTRLADMTMKQNAERERAKEELRRSRERADYQRRWSEIDASERRRVKTHEEIDGWFDRGASK